MSLDKPPKPLPRKILAFKRPDGRVDLMCEINDASYTAEVPAEVGDRFLEQVFDLYFELIVNRRLASKVRIVRKQ